MGAVEAIVLIVVAVIGAAATLYVNIRSNQKTRKENDEQHAAGRQLLVHLSTQINGMDGKIDTVAEDVGHIKDWQLLHTKEAALRDKAIAELRHEEPSPQH